MSSGLLEETINRILDEWGVLLPCCVRLLADKHLPDGQEEAKVSVDA